MPTIHGTDAHGTDPNGTDPHNVVRNAVLAQAGTSARTATDQVEALGRPVTITPQTKKPKSTTQ